MGVRKWEKDRLSRPGAPSDNATVESFNGWLRQECLNDNWLMSLEDALHKIESWRILFNKRRPHSAVGWMPPPNLPKNLLVARICSHNEAGYSRL
ncbi:MULTISPECIES: integrase core domain-containing protein [Pantoea]|uniref:integrase core domain-containing protein n=1 Tax=Pantoea TaxID=53335 RepID=UPI000CF51B4A|nr:hypothetical protein B9D02_20530 [Pantoea vagans]PQL27824.1 hypothetical protein C5L22_15510 [Pantoea ananatis]